MSEIRLIIGITSLVIILIGVLPGIFYALSQASEGHYSNAIFAMGALFVLLAAGFWGLTG